MKYGWRKYQQRVLDDLQDHLTDGHLHVIAPPGSGKTVLGLEVAIRLNKPTLILAPTIAIRNQWIQRFCQLFLQTNLTPDWISRDIRNPKYALIYQCVWACLLVFSGSFELLTDLVISPTFIFNGLIVFGVIRLRKTMKETPRPYKMSLYPFVPVVFIFFCVVLTDISFYESPAKSLMGLLFQTYRFIFTGEKIYNNNSNYSSIIRLST